MKQAQDVLSLPSVFENQNRAFVDDTGTRAKRIDLAPFREYLGKRVCHLVVLAYIARYVEKVVSQRLGQSLTRT